MNLMRNTIRRSRRHRMIAGICGGLAEHFGLDPTGVRIIYVLVSILSVAFPGIIVYILLWLIIPQEGELDDDPSYIAREEDDSWR